MVPTPTAPLCLFQLHLRPDGEFLIIVWQRRKRLGPGLQMVLHDMQVTSTSGQLQHYNPFLGHPQRTVVKRNPPRGQNFDDRIWLFTLLGRRTGQTCNYIPTHGLWPMVWLHGQGLGRNMTIKLVTKEFEKQVCGHTSLNGQKLQRYWCPMWMFT